MIISWFSCGVTSAVAAKLAIEKYEDVKLIYFEIGSAHSDNKRFMEECEEWYGQKVESIRSEKYVDQFEVIEKTRYINGPSGARCTTELKKKLRQKVEKETEYEGQVFGFEFSKKEINRAIRFKEQYPTALPLFPLIDAKLTKPNCHALLDKAGIEVPAMYKLGYQNNNCIGCVKGGMGYWNKIRKDFPENFKKMSALEEEIGRSCVKGTFLKDLDPDRGYYKSEIMPDCGLFCDLEFTDIISKEAEDIWTQKPEPS